MASSTGLQSVKHSLRLFFSNKYLYASVVRAMDQTVAATADTRSPEFQDYKSKHDMAAAKGVGMPDLHASASPQPTIHDPLPYKGTRASQPSLRVSCRSPLQRSF
eukprot:scaffold655_cov379-Prasinococcus_capsulatus_cf.AAC.31